MPTETTADWDRLLRASVPERYKKVTSPIGAVQNYIGELEQEVARLRRIMREAIDYDYEAVADEAMKEFNRGK